MNKVCVFGSFVVDNVATMDRFPSEGETIIGKKLKVYMGGKGANQCISLCRLGTKVSMVGMVGDDAYGHQFKQIFNEEGIDISYVFTSTEEMTGCAQVQINKESLNRICVIPGANIMFGEKEFGLVKNELKKCDYLVSQLEMDKEITYKIINYCKENGVKIVLNPAPAAEMPDDVLNGIDYLIPNETELGIVSKMSTLNDNEYKKACQSLLDKGVKHVIVTLGSRGALLYDNEHSHLVKSYSVKAVDTVAAGDSFIGAFTHSLSEGKTILESIQYANAMGALTVQVKGAIPSLHHKDEVDKFIKEHGVSPISVF